MDKLRDTSYRLDDAKNFMPKIERGNLKPDGLTRASRLLRQGSHGWSSVNHPDDQLYLIGEWRINRWGVFEAQTMLGRGVFRDMQSVYDFIYAAVR